jgi:putative ABC transport system permease protein
VIRYAARALGAHLRAGPLLFALSVLGVALGVAAVLSVLVLSRGAVAAFEGALRATAGDAQVAVLPRAGTLDEAILAEVLAEPGVAAAIAVVRADVAVGDGATRVEIAGVDLLAPARGGAALPAGAIGDALSVPGWIAAAPGLLDELALAPGDAVEVAHGSRRVRLRVGARLDPARAGPGLPARLALMDVAQAQHAFGLRGRLSEVAVRVADGADPGAVAERLEARLGPSIRAATTEARRSEASALLAAFRLNLTALSAVSLLVGGFLVHAATRAALARRREELGVLRALGATRAQVLGVVLADAAVLGALGAALGVPLGAAAARANLATVSATLENVYLLEAVERVELSAGLVAAALAVGLAGAIAGAAIPAWEVARVDVRALLGSPAAHGEAGSRAPRLALAAGAVLAAAGALVAALGRDWRPGGFVAALAVLAAAALAAPLAVLGVARAARPRRLGAGYGVRSLAGRLPSTALAAAALAVASSLSVGIAVMVGSFRATVGEWLAETLRADVYVTTTSWRRGGLAPPIAPEVAERLAREPGVVAVDRLRQLASRSGGRRVTVSGFDAATPGAEQRVRLVAGEPARALARVRAGAALVSEPLARRDRLRVGGPVEIETPAGAAALEVAGVYADYGAEAGALLVSMETLARAFGDGPPTNLALHLAPGADAERVVERLRRDYAADALRVRSDRRLRAEALAVFDQTFAVTRLLQGMTLVIAVAGVTLSLLVLARERAAEAALYRALGATRGQLFRLFLGRGAGIALAGAALGLAGGAGVALALVHLVNPAWFGWTFAIAWPWRALALQTLLVLAAAAAAGAYPALRASATPAQELSRDAL